MNVDDDKLEEQKLKEEIGDLQEGRQLKKAEIRKTSLEAQILEQELALKQLNGQKLSAEIISLQHDQRLKEAEVLKTSLEGQKLKKELGKIWLRRAFDAILTNVPLLTALIIAAGGIAGVLWTRQQELRKQEAEEFHRIVTDFSSSTSTLRAGAAAQLGSIACCGEPLRRPQARALLVSAVGSEIEFNVRHSVEAALSQAGSSALADMESRRAELRRELSTAFGRGNRPYCRSFKGDLARLRAMQEGLLLLGGVIARLRLQPLDLQEAPFRCALFLQVDFSGANMHDAILWQADVSGSTLKGADLRGAQLDDADLSDADVGGAQFCNASGLRFKQIRASRNWQTAYYPRSFRAPKRIRGSLNRCP